MNPYGLIEKRLIEEHEAHIKEKMENKKGEKSPKTPIKSESTDITAFTTVYILTNFEMKPYYFIEYMKHYFIYDMVNKETYHYSVNEGAGDNIPFIEDVEPAVLNKCANKEYDNTKYDITQQASSILDKKAIESIKDYCSEIIKIERESRKQQKKLQKKSENGFLDYDTLFNKEAFNLIHREQGNKSNHYQEALNLIIEHWNIHLIKDKLTQDKNNPKVTYYMPFNNIFLFKDTIDLLALINEVYDVKQGIYKSGNKKGSIGDALNGVYKTTTKDYDYICFNNGLINTKTHEFIEETPFPILPYLVHDVDYIKDTPTTIEELKLNYGGSEFIQYVTSALQTPKDQMAFIEYLGYCMMAGNIHPVILFLVGIGGAGKSVALELIKIVTNGNTNNFNLYGLCNNNKTDHCSEVYDCLVAIDPDSSNATIKSSETLKQISGNDSIEIRKLYHDSITADPKEIAKLLVAGNVLPNFKKLRKEDYQRFFFLEFLTQFRYMDNEKENLKELLMDEKELIVSICLNTYFNNGLSIINNQDEKYAEEFYNKYSNPLVNVVYNLVTYLEPVADDVDEGKASIDYVKDVPYVISNEFNNVALQYIKETKTPVDLNKIGELKHGALLKSIREAFNLDDDYEGKNIRVDNKQTKVFYNLEPTEEYEEILKNL